MGPATFETHHARAKLHRCVFWALAALLFGSAVRGGAKALSARGNDLTIYLDAAAEVTRGQSPYGVVDYIYPPFFSALIAPLELLPRGVGVALWQLLSTACVLYGVVAAVRLADAGGRWPWLPWVTLLASLRLWASNLSYGQANAFTFAAAVAALTLHTRGRDRAAGAIVGLACAIKVLPGVLLVLLAIRGRWRGVAYGALGALGASALLPALWVGPAEALALHHTWFERVAEPYMKGGAVLLEVRPYVAGQSLLASAYRALAATPITASDLDARAALARWNPETVHTLVRIVVLMHLVSMAAALFRGRHRDQARDVALAGALALCTVLITGPLVHKAHMAWSALGFASLIERAVAARGLARLRIAVPLSLAVLLVCLSAPLIVGSEFARDVLARNGIFLGIECLWLGLLIEQWRSTGSGARGTEPVVAPPSIGQPTASPASSPVLSPKRSSS